MFLLYHSEGCNICGGLFRECYVNDLHTTTCSGMLGHRRALTLFWEDPWIHGQPVDAIAPDLLRLVRPAARSSRLVRQGLLGAAWVQDIVGELSINAVV
jgi:hypothetical protein